LQRILLEDDGQVCGHHIFSCPSGSGSGGVDSQPASQVLLRLVLVDVGDFEVRGALNGPETWSERRYPTCVLLSTMMMSVQGRRVVDVVLRPSPGRAAGRSRCRLNSGGLTSRRDAVIPIIFFSMPNFVLMSWFARSVDGAPCVPSTVDGVS
jgi:CheY-like chemotaxis protein